MTLGLKDFYIKEPFFFFLPTSLPFTCSYIKLMINCKTSPSLRSWLQPDPTYNSICFYFHFCPVLTGAVMRSRGILGKHKTKGKKMRVFCCFLTSAGSLVGREILLLFISSFSWVLFNLVTIFYLPNIHLWMFGIWIIF